MPNDDGVVYSDILFDDRTSSDLGDAPAVAHRQPEISERNARDLVKAGLDGAVTRDKILAFQAAVAELEQYDFPLKHHFAPGAYAREILLPKDSVIVGKIHRHAHVNVISQGEVIVITEHEGRQHLKAPLTFISKPGTKRVVYALEDTIWTTVHVTDETDLVKIEDHVIAPTYDHLLGDPEDDVALLETGR